MCVVAVMRVTYVLPANDQFVKQSVLRLLKEVMTIFISSNTLQLKSQLLPRTVGF